MGKAYDEADKRPLAWLGTFMYYHALGFEVVCGSTYMRARHKASGAIAGWSTPRDGSWHVPHLLANSLNATYRFKPEQWAKRAERQKIYRKRRRK